ncbi:MAG: hypothetical protein NVS3B20_03870 [Polyangiales bacterium]
MRFLLALCACLTCILPAACSRPGHSTASDQTEGSGHLKTESREVPSFTEIETSGAFVIKVTVGVAKQSVSITADDNLISLVATEVSAGRLTIKTRSSSMVFGRNSPTVTIGVERLSALISSGATTADVTSMKGDALTLHASGAAKVNAQGEVDLLTIKTSGAADLQLFGLAAKRIDVDTSGGASLDLQATDAISGRASGAVRIRYRGTDAVTVSTSGAASVRKG